MSVASCDRSAGASTPSMAKTVEPSGFAMTVLRRSHLTPSNGCCPGLVKRLVTWIPASVGALVVVDFSEDTNDDMRTSLVREAEGDDPSFRLVYWGGGRWGSGTPLHQGVVVGLGGQG